MREFTTVGGCVGGAYGGLISQNRFKKVKLLPNALAPTKPSKPKPKKRI